ncbi:MAG TPA: hypothetical protein VMS92_18940 [Mycobacterium sp.]|nr:hypothetical protein [Mycobacterium sp.]
MGYAIIWTIVICGFAALAYWAVTALRTPEPLANVVRVGAVVIAIVVIVMIWLGVFGMGPGMPPVR